MEGNLEIEEVNKYFGDFLAVDNASLTVNQGEFFTILGPSGSGKTTLLKMIAGFEEVNAGVIRLNSESIASKESYERNIGMVFQNYALFPHMTVAENIAYPLKRRKVKKQEIEKKVKEVLEMVQLNQYYNDYPSQLSGGQQQRIALSRAIVFSPPLLLLDEPLGALDKNLRQKMQLEVRRIQQDLNITTVSVTHDQEEALTMSDRVCIMNEGGIEQIDTPENIYKHPKNKFVAEFIGEINLIDGILLEEGKEESVVRIFKDKIIKVNNNSEINNKNILVALRPECIQVSNHQTSFQNVIKAKVTSLVYLGDAVTVNLVKSTGEKLIAKVPSVLSNSIIMGEERLFGWNSEDATVLNKEENQVITN